MTADPDPSEPFRSYNHYNEQRKRGASIHSLDGREVVTVEMRRTAGFYVSHGLLGTGIVVWIAFAFQSRKKRRKRRKGYHWLLPGSCRSPPLYWDLPLDPTISPPYPPYVPLPTPAAPPLPIPLSYIPLCPPSPQLYIHLPSPLPIPLYL